MSCLRGEAQRQQAIDQATSTDTGITPSATLQLLRNVTNYPGKALPGCSYSRLQIGLAVTL